MVCKKNHVKEEEEKVEKFIRHKSLHLSLKKGFIDLIIILVAK